MHYRLCPRSVETKFIQQTKSASLMRFSLEKETESFGFIWSSADLEFSCEDHVSVCFGDTLKTKIRFDITTIRASRVGG